MVGPCLVHGGSMVNPWLVHGWFMVGLWCFRRGSMVLPWHFRGGFMVSPWGRASMLLWWDKDKDKIMYIAGGPLFVCHSCLGPDILKYSIDEATH